MKNKKYFIHSTAAGCTSNLWESAVYDDYLKNNEMERVYSPKQADMIIVNTCSVTPGFEQQSEDYIEKLMRTEMDNVSDKKMVIAGCYSAIRSERINETYVSKNKNITHMKPIEMEKLSQILDIDHQKKLPTYNNKSI